MFDLSGAEEAERGWLEAMERGRMHHAWLLVGPEGVGKATFAYRAARRLLGARPDPAHGLLGSDPDDPVSRQVAARSHPDLLVLEREVEDGKARRNIPVDEARRLPEFFHKAPAISPWRVAIIDAADDLNANSANAVLKTLEEPPPKGVLLLVCHAPGRLLPTIRSRCRRLLFRPWPDEAVAAFLQTRTELDADQSGRIAAMAKGSPGRALALAAADALEIDRAALELLRQLPQVDETALLALAGELRGQEGARRFELLFERLAEHVKTMVEETAGQPGAGRPEPWLDAWDQLTNLPAEAEGLNLDRQDAFWTAVGALREAASA
ncbi:MAG TPA: DNA polymerase III subunit delta' [Caulobacteraceae bacterium]